MGSSRHTWAASLVAAEVALVVGLALLFQAAKPTIATHDWEAGFSALAAVILLALIVLLIGGRLERPRLIIDSPVVQTVSVQGGGPQRSSAVFPTGASVTSAPMVQSPAPEVAYLHVRNAPRRGSQMAQGVHIALEFFAADGVSLLYPSLFGRWSHTPQDVGYETTQRAVQEDLLANGVEHRFDVALKYPGDTVAYAMNDENRYKAPDLRFRPLSEETSLFRVVAQGSNVYLSRYFVLYYSRPGGHLRIGTLADAPGWRFPRLRRLRANLRRW
jgi:hypothetical protein